MSQVLASMLRAYFPIPRQKEEPKSGDVIERSPFRQFCLFWLGAMVFLYPLFLAIIAWNINRLFGGGWRELILLLVFGLVPCAVLAVFVGWLLTTGNKTRQSRVRLFLTGFLLPYLVAFLLSRLMQTEGM